MPLYDPRKLISKPSQRHNGLQHQWVAEPTQSAPKTRKPAGMTLPANRRRYEMVLHLIFLPLVMMILGVKVKVIKVKIVRKAR